MFGFIDDDETRAILAAEYIDNRGRGCRRVPGADDDEPDTLNPFSAETIGARISAGFEILNGTEN